MHDQSGNPVREKKAPVFSAEQVIDEEYAYINQCFPSSLKEDYAEYREKVFRPYLQDLVPWFRRKHNYPEAGRPLTNQADDLPVYGLALSGGGIRSASFGIGVIQALSNEDMQNAVWNTPDDPDAPTEEWQALVDHKGVRHPSLFSKLRYLSSVSGGGYSGASLTWYQQCHGFFPFGSVKTWTGHVDSTQKEGADNEAKGDRKPNEILGYIRTNGKYLIPKGIGVVGLLASVFMSVLHSTIIYFLVSMLVFFGLLELVGIPPLADWVQTLPLYGHMQTLGTIPLFQPGIDEMSPERTLFATFFYGLALLFASLFLLIMFGYGIASRARMGFSSAHGKRVSVQQVQGKLIVLMLSSLVLMLIPLIAHHVFGPVLDPQGDIEALGAMSGTGGVSVFLAIRQLRSNIKRKDGPGIVEKILTALSVPGFIVLLLSLAFVVADTTMSRLFESHTVLALLVIVVTVFLAFCVNINQISPHKMYRDRLMETFLKTPEVEDTASLEKRAAQSNVAYLKDLVCNQQDGRWTPYHLINCNLILSNARAPKYRGRLGDSFTLSPLFCGSTATRYLKTGDFADGKMTLPTAMAISGAAANPHAGNFGEGESTSSGVSYLMAFFGLRLGYWVFNPARSVNVLQKLIKPNYVNPGLFSLLNFNHSEKDLLIEISDGGHFDNTGVYELIRRRVPYIILADGGADEEETFDSLGNMIERCRVDFGANIRFLDGEFDLSGILPKSLERSITGSEKLYAEKYELSERGFAIGDIIYPGKDGFVGKFIYIKTCITPGLPGDIYAYKSANPSFPDQPTADQFFDERQFESYRELGYQLTKQMLQNKKAMSLLP